MKKSSLLLFLALFHAGVVCAFDFGVLLDQTVGAGGVGGGDTAFDYTAALIPYFSTPLGDKGDLFASAGLSAGYDNGGFFAAELLRTEFSWQFNSALSIRAGRLAYADPLDFVVDGLLDGAQVFFDTAVGTLNAGLLYSGLLYKETTRITMTADDLFSYYDDDKYRSSDRLLMTVGWEHPALMELALLSASFTAQFDVNGRPNPYHSQYVTVKAGAPFRQFAFELGGALQIAQDAGDVGAALAGEIGAAWDLPLAFRSRLSFNGRFASGSKNSLVAFVPVTTLDHGSVLKAKLSGISALNLDYTARILQTLSSSIAMTYFIRSDLGTYTGYPALAGGDGNALGGELFGRVIWGPVSDLRLNAGGGVFLPGMGNVAPNAKPQWRIELNLTIACY